MKGYALHCGDIQLKKQQNTTIIQPLGLDYGGISCKSKKNPLKLPTPRESGALAIVVRFPCFSTKCKGVALAFSWKTKKNAVKVPTRRKCCSCKNLKFS